MKYNKIFNQKMSKIKEEVNFSRFNRWKVEQFTENVLNYYSIKCNIYVWN